MNPITETRYNLVRYVVLYGFFAAAYAVVFGHLAGLSAGMAALGGAVFGIVSGFEGLILWNVLKYGTTEIGVPERTRTAIFFRIGRLSLIIVAGILFVAVAVGAEVAVIYLTAEETSAANMTEAGMFANFAATIPARCLLLAAVYVCFVLWYSSVARSEAGGSTEEYGGGYSANEEASENRAGYAVAKPDGGEAPESLERITVRGVGGRIEVIGVNEIVFLQAEGDYVAIVTAGGRWLKEGTMKYFEEALPRGMFVRVHRSWIVAVGHISRIETSGREHTLVLRGGGAGMGAGGIVPGGGTIRISDAGYRLLKRTLGL